MKLILSPYSDDNIGYSFDNQGTDCREAEEHELSEPEATFHILLGDGRRLLVRATYEVGWEIHIETEGKAALTQIDRWFESKT